MSSERRRKNARRVALHSLGNRRVRSSTGVEGTSSGVAGVAEDDGCVEVAGGAVLLGWSVGGALLSATIMAH
jgi:hypothetical protein